MKVRFGPYVLHWFMAVFLSISVGKFVPQIRVVNPKRTFSMVFMWILQADLILSLIDIIEGVAKVYSS